MITFQQLIQRLTHFWEKKGCVIHLGHDLETGAGTFNPATFLRCLGPEPYKTAYVEPSRRPSDGRYGDNPNRMQLFHQYQVIIKPSPPDIQQMYLDSLEAIGLNLKEHDIRFVHDDWESPTLGAWGLGWEVWCDGMEVSQFTYFQAIGSLPLKPIPAEITYGLERLLMYIQGVDNIYDLKWNETLTLKDISRQNEIEWSAYNFTYASVDMWKRHFEDFEKEAKALIGEHFPLPAYDFVIKASHAFNMLDARGVISVTERTGYIARIRDLARLIAMEYVSSREKLGFPLCTQEKEIEKLPPKIKETKETFDPSKKTGFLLEIGSEQLPASFIPIGCKNLEKAIRSLLEGRALSFKEISVYATPRRLAIHVKEIAEGTLSKTTERKGPPISTTFDEKGIPTQQGLGFLKSIGFEPVNLEAIRSQKIQGLSIQKVKDVEYLMATIQTPGISTKELLNTALPGCILGLEFPKKMRWGSLDISYPRPLHWIVALLGQDILSFEVGDIQSGNHSFGHAQLKPEKFFLKHPQDYISELKNHFVMADIQERKKAILNQLEALEKEMGGKAIEIERVLKEVLYLSEWPTLTFATFDPKFLKAPREVLISEMIEHQRYFPVEDASKSLKNLFVITADNTPNELIKKGNQKVLSARLSDGVFLYEQDLKQPLEEFNKKLSVMTFQKELGSMLDKVMRITSHAKVLNTHLEMADDKKLLRAALLCKADLASALVKEFPELQGTVGKYYAQVQNEDKDVALAIEEHWFPKSEDAPLPQNALGTILSLADKIDNLLGYYSVGLKPSSSSDPYGLRRQTFGIIKMLILSKEKVNLKEILTSCLEAFSALKPSKEIIDEILQFITSRAKTVFEDHGFKKDEVEASLKSACLDPYDEFSKLEALHTFRNSGEEFSKLLEVYKRAKGQLEGNKVSSFDASLAKEDAEQALLKAIEKMHEDYFSALKESNYLKAFKLLATLQPYLATLFEKVKILDDNLSIRQNRVALLQKVFSYFEHLLDFSKIQELKK